VCLGVRPDFEGVLRTLRRPFTIKLEMDGNRIEDGLALRQEFREIYYDCPIPGIPCTVLEVLIALARRMEYITWREDLYTAFWFWEMVDNLELNPRHPRVENERIIDTWMARKFSFNGIGSPFPLKKCNVDQTKIEIWYQMQNYMIEMDDIFRQNL
jgi:hypothetical protein